MSHAQKIFLGTGEMVVSTVPCEVRTILGSCVGVALYDPRRKVGGLCHYLLANDPDLDEPGSTGGSVRYGQVAIPALARRLIKAGSDRRDLLAVVAGGALLLDANEVFFVGEKNIRLAFQVLENLRIPIVYHDIGGDRGRRMVFHTHNGHYSISLIPETDPDTLTI